MKKLASTFFSMTSTGVLLVVFAFSIAYATFIENDYGTATARILVYNAIWFEILLLLLAINLAGSVFYYKLIKRHKWAILLFHSAFLVILAGAAVTRLNGFEGSLHIREGSENNRMMTEATYITITAEDGGESKSITKEVRFSPYTRNPFKEGFKLGSRDFTVENLKFVPSATETVVEDPEGGQVLAMLAVDHTSPRTDFLLRPGESKEIGAVRFSFLSSSDSTAFTIREEGGRLFFLYSDTVFATGMEQGEMARLEPGVLHPFSEKLIYQAGETGFVLKKYLPKGKPELIYVPSHAGTVSDDALHIRVTSGDDSGEIFAFGSKGKAGLPGRVTLGGVNVAVSYGSEVHELPFSLRLNDFQIERYPGSNSPSSFASEVTLVDPGSGVEKPFRIFMNNILKYKGYRFFQSSFDEDEQGTVLSVNYDWAGTALTYAGYFLMTLGMILTLFSRRSRFYRLVRASARLSGARKSLFPVILLAVLLLQGISASGQQKEQAVLPSHSVEFGKLLVQSTEGRIEPVNTLASEVLRKVAKKGSFQGLSPVQVLLEVMCEPEKWRNVPVIRVGDAELRRILGASGDYVSFSNILKEGEGDYLLRDYVEKAYGKKPAERNKFDKEVINVDERVNILYKYMTGGFLTIYPVPGDPNNKWLSPAEAMKSEAPGVAAFAEQTYSAYFSALRQARSTGDYKEPDRLLSQLKANQKRAGDAVHLPEFKTSLEIFYINFNIFSKLARLYVFLGLFLMVVQFYALLSSRMWPGKIARAGFWVVLLLFMVHTAGLGIRWYISGHAPWSNGYETLLYISWATCLAGLLFAKRSPMTLSVTTLLSAISLFVAGMSWMSPELTNLVPVLKSYWLVIHVAVITASYGFFGLAALLGIVNLVLIIILSVRKNEKISFTLRELVLVIEMSVIIGLFMLTVGSFLGGVWANESWGRYWGWDPKETWAMVTILVYAFIVHMHKIPGFKGSYAMSFASLVGFGSVLMTFFGVNYYLSGLHSYAQGEPVPIPSGVYVAVALILLLGITAWLSDKRRTQDEVENEWVEEN